MRLTANVTTLQDIMLNTIPNDIAILVEGNHGTGKTQIVQQIARKYLKEDGSPLYKDENIIIFQASQLNDVGDIIGMPFINGQGTKFLKTEYADPYWLTTSEPVFLFLDELNRAHDFLTNALMQLTLEKKIQNKELHKDSRILSAINNGLAGGNYSVDAFDDDAKKGRFCIIEFKPTVNEFLAYAKQKEFHKSVISFIEKHPDFLDAYAWKKETDENDKQPDRRSWEFVSKSLSYWEKNKGSKLSLQIVCQGFVGNTIGLKFVDFHYSTLKLTIEQVLNLTKKELKNYIDTEVSVVGLDFLSQEIINLLENKKFTKKEIENFNYMLENIQAEFKSLVFNKINDVQIANNNFLIKKVKEFYSTVDTEEFVEL